MASLDCILWFGNSYRWLLIETALAVCIAKYAGVDSKRLRKIHGKISQKPNGAANVKPYMFIMLQFVLDNPVLKAAIDETGFDYNGIHHMPTHEPEYHAACKRYTSCRVHYLSALIYVVLKPELKEEVSKTLIPLFASAEITNEARHFAYATG